MTCKFCHEDLSTLPPEANIFRHQIGLCAPSHNEVDSALLEIEELEKKLAGQAMDYARKQQERQRKRLKVINLGARWVKLVLALLCFAAAGSLFWILMVAK